MGAKSIIEDIDKEDIADDISNANIKEAETQKAIEAQKLAMLLAKSQSKKDRH